MTEEEALLFFDGLPVEHRLRLMQRMLADMEQRVARARAELSGLSFAASVQQHEPEAAQLDLPGIEIPDSPSGFTRSEPKSNDEWADFELPDITGGQAHNVHSLRLLDAAAQYERLLKHYGYLRRQPGLAELARRNRMNPRNRNKETDKAPWANWVAKDQETLDRPKSQEWSDWVVSGDDAGDW